MNCKRVSLAGYIIKELKELSSVMQSLMEVIDTSQLQSNLRKQESKEVCLIFAGLRRQLHILDFYVKSKSVRTNQQQNKKDTQLGLFPKDSTPV